MPSGWNFFTGNRRRSLTFKKSKENKNTEALIRSSSLSLSNRKPTRDQATASKPIPGRVLTEPKVGPTESSEPKLSSLEAFQRRQNHPRRQSLPSLEQKKKERLKKFTSSLGVKSGGKEIQNLRARHHPTPGMIRQQSDVTGGSTTSLATNKEESPASVENLVRKCAECFDIDGSANNEAFPRILYLTHLWFMTSEQLMVLFTQLYKEETGDLEQRKKMFYAIRFWINETPHLFDLDLKLVRALRVLQEFASRDPGMDTSIIDPSNKASYKWMTPAQMSVRPNQLNRKRRKVSLVFNHLRAEEIAIHMSYLEYKSFRRLTLSDFHNYAMHGSIKDNLRLERAIVLFNNITHWVQCMVLDHHNPQERAVAIVKFVEIAKKLQEMRNFNTLMAVVGALTHTVISRMKKTMAAVPKDTLKILEDLVELLDSKANYCGYRRAYAQITNEFKIPVIGILMKDMIALHAALPDRVGDGLINVRKMMLLGTRFKELTELQRCSYPYEVNRDLVNTLRVSLYLYYSEEEIYQLSLSLEPRETKQSVSGSSASPIPIMNMGFGEFAKYTCQLDNETIKQHVSAMVTSVFKAYDENSDGYISENEFNFFIKNFPGMATFNTVDKDQDGRISTSEMLDYFLRISSSRRNEFCKGFKHNFAETSYFHPTFCEECQKLLWGLVKQGWKCRDCGINCHKHCKDRIVLECKAKINNKTPKKMKQIREKTSISSESDVNGDFLTSATANLTLEDETFEDRPMSTSSMRRSTSLAASDFMKHKSKVMEHRKGKHDSKTPPPSRKTSSPVLSHGDFGKVSLQKKMQIMLKKRTSAKRIMNSSATQTSLSESAWPQDGSGGESGPSEVVSPVGSFLYGKTSSQGQKNGQSRLSSTGEEINDESDRINSSPDYQEAHSEIEHGKMSSFSYPTSSLVRVNAPVDNNNPVVLTERRDSGCSCTTFISGTTSTPVTPVFVERTSETTFLYPTSKTLIHKTLLEDNTKLKCDNERLRADLDNANGIIRELHSKLSKA